MALKMALNAHPLPLPQVSDLPEAVQALLARRPPVHLYRMVAHAPALVEPFMTMVLANFNALSLDAALREAVILRVAAHHRSDYEQHHHRRMAAQAGLSDAAAADILSLAPSSPHWDARTGGHVDGIPDAMAFTDALLLDQPLDQPLVQRLTTRHGPRGYVELSMLVGFYRMVATFIDATGLRPEVAG